MRLRVLVVALLTGCGVAPSQPRQVASPRAEVPFLNASLPGFERLLPQPRPAGFTTTPQIAAGPTYACGLKTSGQVSCWGTGPLGQLGLGGADQAAHPPRELPLSQVRQIAAGPSHACALLEGGEVQCWGSNGRGQLGLSDRDGQAHGPTRLPLPAPAKALADNPLCAISEDDDVYCWGEVAAARPAHDSGEIARFDALPAVRSVSVSDDRVCAVSFEAEVLCWSGAGEPARVALPGLLTQVSEKSGSGCALDAQGHAFCWGALPRKKGDLPGPPAEVRGLSGATRVSVGDGLGCALRREGTVACWGDLLRGGPWSWDLEHIAPPSGEAAEVPGVGAVTDLALGRGFSCALRRDGRVMCWGSNEAGISGTGLTDPPSIAPRVVPGVELR